MCGTPLESPRPAAAIAAPQDPLRAADERRREPRQAPVVRNGPLQAPKPAAIIAGPSLLGLNPDSDGAPSIDTLREKTFAGGDSFLETEEPERGGRRILVLLLLLLALGAAARWTYSNYVGATNRAHQAASSSPAASQAAQSPVAKPEAPAPQKKAVPSPADASSSASATKAGTQKSPTAAAPKPAIQVKATRAKSALAETAAPASPASAAGGDADYRKAEAYLYGRGVAQDCDEAVKYLKAASAKQNAKARSTFGTMYATGHCVPRDLPTSYGWFALALHVDPNNQILEKDLTAIWNQMTPPERETATKSKQ